MNKTHTQSQLQKLVPALTLFILAPFIPEILMGSTPVSRAGQWPLEFAFYGSAALLLREIICRYKLSWHSVFFLGLTFGITEEALLLQSVFNPDFLGHDISYGRLWGVNWVWAQFILGYHTIFSISIPIFLTETIFRRQVKQPWVSKTGVGIFTFIFFISSILFYYGLLQTSGYQASLLHYAGAVLLIFLLVVLSFKIKSGSGEKSHSKPGNNFNVGIIGFLGSIVWLAGLYPVFSEGFRFPPWLIMLAGMTVLFVFCVLISRLYKKGWSLSNRYFSISGALVGGMGHGFVILYQAGNKSDIYFQSAFILITLILIILVYYRRIKSEER